MRKSLARVGGSLLALLLATGAHAASKVQLVKDGATVALPHVAAARYVDGAGKAEIRLLFSSVPATGVVLADAFGDDTVHSFAADGKATMVKVTFEEAAPEQYSMAVYHAGKVTSGGGTRIDGDVKGVVRKLTMPAGKITGTLDADTMGSVVTGTFDAPLTTAKAAAAVKGAGVLGSPQGKVLLQFATAMYKKDFATAQKYSARDVKTEMDGAAKQMGAAFLTEMLKEFEPRAFEASLKSADAELIESGDSTMIRLVEKRDGGTSTKSFRLVKVGSDWKVK